MKKQSAGLIVFRINNGQLEALIAHMGGPFHATKDAGHWTIPKGEYEEGEDPQEVAKREFKEELGIEPPAGEWLKLGQVEYTNKKTVTVWAVQADLDIKNTRSNTFTMEWPPRSGKTQEFPEIDKAAYMPIATAAAKLIPAQVPLLERLVEKLNLPAGPSKEPSLSQETLL